MIATVTTSRVGNGGAAPAIALYCPERLLGDVLEATFTASGVQVLSSVTRLPDLLSLGQRPDALVVAVRGAHQDCDGIDLLRQHLPSVPIVVLLGLGIALPACGRCAGNAVIDAREGVARLIGLVAGVLAGDHVSTRAVHRPELSVRGRGRSSDVRDCLTGREREVLVLLMDGLSTIEIARRSEISNSTARTHVKNVLAKLGAHTRLQLFVMVRDLDVLDDVG